LENIELVRTVHEIWSTGNLDLVTKVYAPNFIGYWPPSSDIPVRRGIDGVISSINKVRRAFPDWHEEILEIFGIDGHVASRFLSSGTHQREFGGIAPSHERIAFQEMATFEVVGGLISRQWLLIDDLSRLRQLRVTEDYVVKLLV